MASAKERTKRGHDYAPGETIPGTHYVVVRPIGAGGMGQVYEVEDITVGRRFVLKALHSELRGRVDLAERLRREARALAQLNHPNIVQVFTAGVTADRLRLPYFVMERLEGECLRALLARKGRLGLRTCYTIGIELLEALDRAHEFGIVHRDIKPDNILLHRNGDGTLSTKLIDFGVMGLVDEDVGVSRSGRFIGTLSYAAPEQVTAGRITAKTDLYSASLVLYAMLVGHGPFDDHGDPASIARAHGDVATVPPPPSMFVDCPAELSRIILAGLSKNPADRPKDAFIYAAFLRRLKRDAREIYEPRLVVESTIGGRHSGIFQVRTTHPANTAPTDIPVGSLLSSRIETEQIVTS